MTAIADPELALKILLDAGADPAKARVEKTGFGWLVAAAEFGAGCTDAKDNSFDTPQEVAAHLVGKGLSNGGDASSPVADNGFVSGSDEKEPSPIDESQQDENSEQEERSEEVSNEVEHVGVAGPLVDLDALKEALRLRILAEAVRRSGMSMELFERINTVHKVIGDENASAAAKNDAELELQMHGVWSERAKVIDTAKTQKLVEVMGLETLDEINAYDVNAGWP